jgi:hypothetical protein
MRKRHFLSIVTGQAVMLECLDYGIYPRSKMRLRVAAYVVLEAVEIELSAGVTAIGMTGSNYLSTYSGLLKHLVIPFLIERVEKGHTGGLNQGICLSR